jgi:hypothetical protein
MSSIMMSVSSGRALPNETRACTALFSAYWLSRGSAETQGSRIGRGEGALLKQGEAIAFRGQTECDWVRFDLSIATAPEDAILAAPISLPTQPTDAACLLRLDQVTFPPGGIAWRHVHPGDGIRFLIRGGLRIIGDTHQETAGPGHAWFEHANSPVRAEADQQAATTSFVRFMVLPSAFVGKPTIQILDKHEAEQPRVQVTQRHVDKLAYVVPG